MAIPYGADRQYSRPAQLIRVGLDVAAERITAQDHAQLARYAHVPVKQAVIATSALSLLYPADGIDGYPREAFLADLVHEAAADIRGALDRGAHSMQIDFTEGRLAVKLDPAGQLLRSFIDLNNQGFAPFGDDTSTARETAFAKIRAHVAGTRTAAAELGL
jgi:hypothetical protein